MFTNFILPIIVGAGLFIISLYSINKSVFLEKQKVKKSRRADSECVIHIKVATIADDLVPLLEKMTVKKLVIFGGDGYYFSSKNNKKWINGLRDTIKSNAEVTYILLDRLNCEIHQTDVLIGKLVPGIKVKIATESELEKLKNSLSSDTEVQIDVVRLHPTIILTSDGLAYWIEKYHPEHSEFAYNISFISPKSLQTDEVKADIEICKKYAEIFKLDLGMQ